MSTKLERARARKLSSFKGLSAQKINRVAALALRAEGLGYKNIPEGRKWLERRKQIMATKTIGDVIDGWEVNRNELYLEWESGALDSPGRWRQPFESHVQPLDKWVMAFLIEQGVTILDWRHMPINTVAPEKLGKVFWVKRVASDLPSLSKIAYWKIQDALQQSSDAVTVEQLLTLDPEGDRADWKLRHSWTSIHNTRALLYRIGFRYEDGPFMQAFTKRQLRESVMAKLELSERSANKLMRDARELGWVNWRWEK